MKSTKPTIPTRGRYFEDRSRDSINWNQTLTYISLCQDGTLSHYSQPFPLDDIIDPETCNVLMRCTRVGRAARLLWKEIILMLKHVLLNDDNNDNDEKFGEYVKSTKQLKQNRR